MRSKSGLCRFIGVAVLSACTLVLNAQNIEWARQICSENYNAPQFSGAAPGFAGLNQINVRIPSGTRTASNIAVVIAVTGKQSNTVTIPVGP